MHFVRSELAIPPLLITPANVSRRDKGPQGGEAIAKVMKLRSIKDLVNVAISAQIPLVHHAVIGERHVYFVPYMAAGDSSIIYYVESDNPIEYKYLVYNNFDGSISFENRIRNDARLSFIPIVEVEEQNLLPEKMFKPGRRSRQ